MDALVDELLGELNCETVFTIPLFGGIPINESIVVTWIMMAAVLLICLLLTHVFVIGELKAIHEYIKYFTTKFKNLCRITAVYRSCGLFLNCINE